MHCRCFCVWIAYVSNNNKKNETNKKLLHKQNINPTRCVWWLSIVRSLLASVQIELFACFSLVRLIFTIGLCFHSISSKSHCKPFSLRLDSFFMVKSIACGSYHIVVHLRLFKWNLWLGRLGISLYYFLIWHANRCRYPMNPTRKIIFLCCLFSDNTRSLCNALLCTADGCGFSTDGYNKNFKIRSRSLSQKFCARWKTLHNPDVNTHTYRHSAKENHGTSDSRKEK